MRRIERRVRLGAGLVLAVYVVQHLFGLWAGLVSLQWMEYARSIQTAVWHTLPGTIALYGALFVHFLLALRSLARRRTLRMPAWEALQLSFGLLIPLLLVTHVVGTRLTQVLLDIDTTYEYVVSVLWSNDWYRIKQIALLLIVWAHAALGVHFWLRLRAGYRRMLAVYYALAVLIPAIAIAGFVRAGFTTGEALKDPAFRHRTFAAWDGASPHARAQVLDLSDQLLWLLLAIIAAVLLANWVRGFIGTRRRRFSIFHPHAGALSVMPGQSVLEVLRAHGVPHASVCGGRARCTTCRIRIGRGAHTLSAPVDAERAALARIQAPDHVRLACQLRPREEMHFDPVLPPDASVQQRGGVAGREQQVAAMFVDLRGSTSLGEDKLPYDVVFVLNRFFAEMSAALDATSGHYAQFAGDGLLALYGLEEPIERACRNALRGAIEMQRRVDLISAHLAGELASPLRIGIGVHAGEAIVGTMGPPSAPNLSAVGDHINVAARLESLTKDFGCVLVVSEAVLVNARISAEDLARHEVTVRGRNQALSVFSVAELSLIEQRLRESSTSDAKIA